MENIFYVLERIFKISHIPIHYYDKTGEITLLTLGQELGNDPFASDIELRKRVIARSKAGDVPALDFEDDMLCGVCEDAAGCHIILGPVCRNKPDPDRLRSYANRHGLTAKSINIKQRTLDQMCACLALLHHEIHGGNLKERNIIIGEKDENESKERIENTYQTYELEYAEQEQPRFNFAEEMKYIKLIKNGDVESLKKLMDTAIGYFDDYSVGVLAQKAFKQHEYMACSLIIIASRAAIDAGLEPLTSYLMSDLYLQQLEKCSEIQDIHKLTADVLFGYTERVRQKLEERSRISYVEQSKNFIATHLNKRFTVEELAKEIGIDRTYLSKRFSLAEGMGIQEYTRIKRIEAAAKMLKFSDESILTISNYFCFTSQSHFGKVFREYMGQTPQKYRDSNKMLDFK